jgi:adenine deaminase
MNMGELISVARGDIPADLLLTSARIINTLNGEIEEGNVAVYAGLIAGVGDYHEAKEKIDLKGRYLAPGLINGHTHLESSMLDVGQYARAVVPHGTSAIVTDLHEIANVAGLEGIKYVLKYARRLPLALFLMAPSCVPATHLETSGASIGPDDIRRILRYRECIGLGEMMNYPGVVSGDAGVLRIIEAAGERIIDGHAPGVSGKDLSAYLAAGMRSDHESVTLEEAAEKLRRGMYIMIREGSSEKNLEALLPLVTDRTYKRCFFVVDDRSCGDLLRDGDIDAVVRKAIRLGMDPVRAIRMATINTADYFRLNRLGAIAPGFYANFIVLDDLRELRVDMVFYHGHLVAGQGSPLFALRKPAGETLTHTVNIGPFKKEALRLPARKEIQPVIEVIPGQIVTRRIYEKVPVVDGFVQPDVRRDILKAAVVERHKATGNLGLGLVKGFGLRRGALASSTAHDSHNIVVVGVSDEDIFAAVKEIERIRGGLVVVSEGKVMESLPTPIAGLLSEEPLEKVVADLQNIEQTAGDMGVTIPSPFAVLSFLALPVIPEIRLTDLGLVDVNEFKLIK